ncbi:hypothetical protein [Hungatella effluvii]|uniref:hypothetical protein n=1 Tax=Hungatella effluvii TaxID=1096246 RepID=UPI002A807DB0|nr:hypothetical protein [Hungatella effluvii]
MKRLISAFHKSFSVFGFWLLAFLFSFTVSTGTQRAGGSYRVSEYPFLRGD